MIERIYTNQFKKDVKLLQKRGWRASKLEHIVDLLCHKKKLPDRCRPHVLHGDYDGFWECHVEPDWLLIYRLTENSIVLTRTGTHSDLF